MIEQTGLVLSVRGGMAEVQAERRSACGSCAGNAGCGTSVIARLFGRRETLLRAQDNIGVGPGDRVVIGLPESALLEASFLAYLVPLLSMIGGAMAGAYVAAFVAPAQVQGLSVLTGLGGLAAALAWLVRFCRNKSLEARYQPRILRRAERVGQSGVIMHFQDSDFPG
jgi:sigma-E factor negative regulatory protein RseC